MKFSVGLFDGGMNYVKHLVAVKIVEADDFTNIDPLAQFYDIVEKDDYHTTYQNRITKGNFDVYYFRCLHLTEDIRSYDFGSYSRFCAIIKGEHSEEEYIKLINESERN